LRTSAYIRVRPRAAWELSIAFDPTRALGPLRLERNGRAPNALADAFLGRVECAAKRAQEI